MSYVNIAAKAAIAILVVIMSWRIERKRKDKWLITSVVALWVLTAVLDMGQERKTASERNKLSASQRQMADALNVLKMNSEQDKKNKEAEAQRRQKIHSQLVMLMEKGKQSREDCQNPQSQSEQAWTKKVELYLHGISLADETVFKVSETGLVCYQSMSIKLSSLQKIMDEYN